MKYEHNFYRTRDRLLDIEFLFLDLGHEIGWRAYVLTDINYKMRDLAQMWSEITAYYIRYGGAFGDIQCVLSEQGVI